MYKVFEKSERIVSQKQIDQLFGGNSSHSMAAFPLRVVYIQQARTDDEPPVKVLISVSKRKFKHAVDRNRVKRQIREAYRLNKHLIFEKIAPQNQLAIAFIWISDSTTPSNVVSARVRALLKRIANNLEICDVRCEEQ